MLTKTRALSADTPLTLDPAGADFSVVGHIEPREQGFHTELVLRDARGQSLGERIFDSPARSCRALDDSLVLALALLVDSSPLREAARGERPSELEEIAPPLRAEELPSARSTPPPVATPPAVRRWRAWGVELGTGPSVAVGFLPKPTVGWALSVAVRPPGLFPIALRAAGYPFGISRPTIPGEGIAIRGLVGGLEACPLVLTREAVEARACGGAHLAMLHAEPLGPRTNSDELFFLVLPVRAEIRARASVVEPYAAVSARFAPTSLAFVYGPPGGVERTSFAVPWATVELDVGVSWRVLP